MKRLLGISLIFALASCVLGVVSACAVEEVYKKRKVTGDWSRRQWRPALRNVARAPVGHSPISFRSSTLPSSPLISTTIFGGFFVNVSRI